MPTPAVTIDQIQLNLDSDRCWRERRHQAWTDNYELNRNTVITYVRELLAAYRLTPAPNAASECERADAFVVPTGYSPINSTNAVFPCSSHSTRSFLAPHAVSLGPRTLPLSPLSALSPTSRP